MRTKRCYKCGIVYKNPTEHFNKHRGEEDGLQRTCKYCLKEVRQLYREYQRNYTAQYYKDNKEYLLNYKKKWKQENYDKVAAANRRREEIIKNADGNYTRSDTDKMLAEQKMMCAYCGCELTFDSYHTDHILPLSRGGTHHSNNIVCVCQLCNQEKHTKTLVEWFNL